MSQDFKVYMFTEGYIRTSGARFTLQDCEEAQVHLTNNAIQKNTENYGELEDGNQLSYAAAQAKI